MAPNRRPHRKSRHGCVECKRRHVKCDESHPECVNCSTSQLRCSFRDKAPPAGVLTPNSTAPDQHMVSPEASSSASPLPVQDHPIQEPEDPFDINLHHLELLSHFMLDTCNSFGSTRHAANIDIFCRLIKNSTSSAPYLMYETLAVAALHLSHQRPDQRKFYRDEATGLQTRGLSLFNSIAPGLNRENCVPMFLYSSILGIHVLADVATAPDNTIDGFLDRFIFSMDIRRGIRAIIADGTWEILLQSELKPILEGSTSMRRGEQYLGRECEGLWELLQSADLSASAVQYYQEAIVHLQRAFDFEHSEAGKHGTTGVAFVWPVHVSAEYTDLLLKRRPEALIILAHYAILLHCYREQWFIGDSGRMLIKSITTHLGAGWNRWLAWPNAVLETDFSISR